MFRNRILPLTLLNIAGLLVCFFIAACSGEWKTYPKTPEGYEPVTVSVLRAGDVIEVNVYGEDELSGDYTVSPVGTIIMPLVGAIDVEGLTPVQVGQNVRNALIDGGYLVDPQVIVSADKTLNYYIMGEVLKSGEYDYKSGLTLLEAVAKAGGFTYRANQTKFDIVRQNMDGGETIAQGTIATAVMPGDVIRVRERLF